MNDKYNEVRKKFNNGDWVFGVGDHKGCSMAFDMETNAPQPFSYLNAIDPNDFRIATEAEVTAANHLVNEGDL